MTKIPLFNEEALDVLWDNVQATLDHYRNGDRGWAVKFLKEKGYEPDGYLDFATVHLQYENESTKLAVDFKNAKMLHQKLRFDDRAQASNGLIWTFISLDNLPYLLKRWPLPESDEKAVEVIRTRYIYPWTPSKSQFRRSWIASLWRVADLTFDKDRKDPYELTEEAFMNSDMIQSLTDRLPFMNRQVTSTLLEYSLKRRQEGNGLSKADYQDVAVFINALAGSIRIDSLSSEDMRKRIEDFFRWRAQRLSSQTLLDSFSESSQSLR